MAALERAAAAVEVHRPLDRDRLVCRDARREGLAGEHAVAAVAGGAGAQSSLAQTVSRPGAEGKSDGIDTTCPSSSRKSRVTLGATLPVAVSRMNVWKKPLAAPSARNHCLAGAIERLAGVPAPAVAEAHRPLDDDAAAQRLDDHRHGASLAVVGRIWQRVDVQRVPAVGGDGNVLDDRRRRRGLAEVGALPEQHRDAGDRGAVLRVGDGDALLEEAGGPFGELRPVGDLRARAGVELGLVADAVAVACRPTCWSVP